MDKEKELRSLKEENRKLKENLNQLNRELVQQLARIGKLEEEIQRLKDENQKLRLELFGLKPPKKKEKKSSDGVPRRESKKLGPPVGHKGISRKKPEKVDRTVVLKLDACPYCDGEISELEHTRERYMEDIVPVTLYVTKYIIKQGFCKKCGKIVYPEVPEVIENCHFGLHFLLYITYLRYVMNLPDNKIVTLLNDIYDAKVSEGTIVDYLKRAAQIFGAEYERIKKQMKELKTCHYDDTGQRVNDMNRWLWVFISNEAMLYYTSKSRSKKVVIEILGDGYDGVTVQDFYPSYDKAPGMKQKCWSHLITDAKDMTEKKKPPPGAKEFLEGLQQIYKDAKEAVKRLGTEEERSGVYVAFVDRLKSFASKGWQHYEVRRLARRALKYNGELFTFILMPGIEPTNNCAERALRPCVVQNKIWGCHRTEDGAKNRDVLMSVMGTMKLQGKNILVAGKEHVLRALA
jgi:regulator of replication initiation timing